MSAIQNPHPTPVITPVPPQVGKPAEPSGGGRWKAGLVIILLLMIAGGVLAWRQWSKPDAAAVPGFVAVKTAKVTVGNLDQSIRIAGQTSSLAYSLVSAPILRGFEASNEMILLSLVNSGTRVKKGDVLAEIDAQGLKDHIEDVEDSVRTADADIKKRRAEQAIDMENLNQTLRVAKAEYDKAVWDAKPAETRTAIDQELLRLAVEESGARHKQQLSDVKQKQIVQSAEIRILEITRERHIRHRNRHKSDLNKYTMRTSMDGLAVVQATFRGGEWSTIQQGDQVRAGQQIVKVVVPEKMQVEANINQAESELFRLGQPATIRVDAFPGLSFPGKVYAINAIAAGGWRQNNYIRNIPVRISIQGSHEKLIPDLSASADILISKTPDQKQVPLEAVFTEKNKSFVFVKRGDNFEQRPVTVGVRNMTHAAITAGLQAGEEVALERPQQRAAMGS